MERELGFIHRFNPGEELGMTLLLLHGTGGAEDDLIDFAKQVAPGAALLSPRGKVLENGKPRFFRRLAEGVFDLEDLTFRTHELADFISAATDQYELDAQSFIALGYSNGANIAASLLLLRPEVLSGAMLFRPMVPFEPEAPPDLSGKRVLIAGAKADPIVPDEQSQRLAGLLESAGADVTLRWHEGGHALAEQDLAAARKWFKKEG